MGAGRMVEREKPLLLVSDYDSMIRGMVLPWEDERILWQGT
jgi:hypothetical protein